MSMKVGQKVKILVVDDEEYTRGFFKNLLGEEGYDVITCANGEEALRYCQKSLFDLVLLDLKIPGGMDGIQILKKIKEIEPNTAVIMISGHGTFEAAFEAVKFGASNFLSKPFNSIDEVLFHINKALEFQKIISENKFLHEQLVRQMIDRNMIGNSSKMQEIFELIQKVAPLDTSILLIGESGTGKELAAKAVHKMSHRRHKMFMTVHCGALPENLLESTLFGYEEGAFTDAKKRTKGYFEEANGGTIFLDEIGEASLRLQVKLLRVLQTGEFQRVGGTEMLYSDMRIISATNKDIYAAVEKKEFRQDLYYRINVINISIPPLRERKEDIFLLSNFFMDKFSKCMHKNMPNISPKAIKLMIEYNWPGNIRQLENVIERAVALCEEDTIGIPCLPPEIRTRPAQEATDMSALNYKEAKEIFEKNYLSQLFRVYGNNVSEVAQKSGIDPSTIYRKLSKHNISLKS